MAKCLLEGCNKILKGKRIKFCCNKHKDKYHNRHNPRGFFAHLNPNSPEYDLQKQVEDSMHPHDSYSLGQDE